MAGNSSIYLASRSPRRRELLNQIGVAHEVLTRRITAERSPDVNEDPLPGEKPREYVMRVCRDKVESGWMRVIQRKLPLRGVLAADTSVCLGDEILGIPTSAVQAVDFLTRLSGREHEVLTAVAFKLVERVETELSVTAVRFRELSHTEIARYVASGEPMDKAGAYGIQGRAGAFIAEIRGSYSGVMGLPLYETVLLLRRFGLAPAG
ncbi:MAG: septum formation inhibitor Maf [Burkholderiales bacterium]|nr:septum formation inhibitor Maf [Burkholderiales bacterium]